MNDDVKDFILSDATNINSHGFRVDMAGGRFDRFDINPVMLYDHNTELLIGRWQNRRIEGVQLLATPIFDLNDPFAAEKARKVKEGFLKGASMGIHILRLDKIGDDYVATEWELIEASLTAIPSDAGAIRLYNEKREVLTFEQVKLSFNQHFNTKPMSEKKINLSASTCKILNLSSDFTERDIEIAVAEKDDEIKQLKADIKKAQDEKIDAFLSAAVDAGKITAEQRADYVELAKTNFDHVKAIIGKLDTKPATSLRDMETRTSLSAGRESWDYMEWMKKDPAGLQNLKLNSPDAFKRLQETI